MAAVFRLSGSLTASCVVVLLLWTARAAAAASPVEEPWRELIEENAKLSDEFDRLIKEKKYDDAVLIAEKAVPLLHRLMAMNPQGPDGTKALQSARKDLTDVLGWLVKRSSGRADWSLAAKWQREHADSLESWHGKDDYRAADARRAVAYLDLLQKLPTQEAQQLVKAKQLVAQAIGLHNQHQAPQALPLAEEALQIRKRLLGDADQQTGDALSVVAALHSMQGEHTRAEAIYRETVDVYRRAMGEKHPNYLSALNQLAIFYQDRGQYDQAEPLYRQAVAVAKDLFGEDHADYALGVNNLAMLFQAQGELARAEPLFRRSLEIRRRVLGAQHPTYARSLNHLASLYREQGKYAQAEPLLAEAREICRQSVGENHPEYAYSLQRLAELYHVRAQSDKAIPLLQQALTIYSATAAGERKERLIADVKSDLADNCVEAGALARAEQLFLEVCETYKKTLGENHVDYANSLTKLAHFYCLRGDYARAESLLSQAIAIGKRTVGDNHPAYARYLGQLGFLYVEKGEYTRAEPLFRASLPILKASVGERHAEYAACLFSLAQTCAEQADYAQAETLYTQACETTKIALGEDHPKYARGLNCVAVLCSKKGDYVRAERLCQQALSVFARAVGEKHPDYANALTILAQVTKEKGEIARAFQLARQAADIHKEILGAEHHRYALSLSDLAVLYEHQGDYARAEPLLRDALAIEKRALGEKHRGYAMILNSLSNLYRNMGDFGKAQQLAQQVVGATKESYGEHHPEYATTLSNLAILLDDREDYAEAERLYMQALQIQKEALGANHPDYALSLGNFAANLQQRGEYARAESLSVQSLRVYQQTLGRKHPDYALRLNNLGDLYASTARYSEAERVMREAIEIRKEVLGEWHCDYAMSLKNLAAVYLRMDRPEAGEPLSRQALAIIRRHLALTAAIQSERQQLAMANMARSFVDNYLALSDAAPSSPEQAYREALAAKGSVWARQQWTRRMRVDPALAAQPAVAKLYAELEQASHVLANLARISPDPKQLEVYRRQLQTASDDVERLQQALAAASGAYRAQRAEQSRTLAEIAQAIPADAVLIDFVAYQHCGRFEREANEPWRRMAAFVLRRNGSVVRVELGPVKPIRDLVEKWRGSFAAAEAAALAQLIWKPLRPFVKDAKLLLVSPDGPVAQFPFAVLPGQDPRKCLLEECAVAVLPVPRMLPEVGAEVPSTDFRAESLLAVGDVDFDAAGSVPSTTALALAPPTVVRGGQPLHWAELPGTRAETAAIAASFAAEFPASRRHLLAQHHATKQETMAQMGQHHYLHFATHGYFAPATMHGATDIPSREPFAFGQMGVQQALGFHPGLLSGLVLAGANRPVAADQDTAILTALEVAEMDLRRVRLVTLSACETGLGKSTAGEGLLGLQRAFQLAGARTVVASLWSVPDNETRALMEEFYKNLWQRKLSPLESLRRAQLEMLARPVGPGEQRGYGRTDPPGSAPPRRSPYYWAAFVLSGDWR